ncbi:hypothetical protein AAC387_Pa08g0851 [Persea americana]
MGIPFCEGDEAVMGRDVAAVREEGREPTHYRYSSFIFSSPTMSDVGVAARRCSSGNNSSDRRLLVVFSGNDRNQY